MRLRTLTAAALGAALVLLAGPAAAQGVPPPSGGINGGVINTGATSATPGTSTPGSGASATVTVPNLCGYYQAFTGPELATFIGPILNRPPQGQIQAHQGATEGFWYFPECSDVGSPVEQAARNEAFYATHPAIFSVPVPVPPPTPVPDLIEAAKDRISIPGPVVGVNPAEQTVVGLQTWVWPQGGQPEPIFSRAESGPNWAQVTATPGKLIVTSPGAESGSCDRAPAYTAGAPDSATDCFVTFSQSSARTGAATITTTLQWRVVLTTSLDPGGIVLDEAFGTGTLTDIAVAEVQSVLR